MGRTPAQEKFMRDTSKAMAKLGMRRARRKVGRVSRTLSSAMSVLFIKGGESWIFVPHYWALMVHDGRRAFRKQRFMVWFRDYRKDPRLGGRQTPQRASQIKRLTPEQFEFWQEQNKIADPDGTNPEARPMIVTKVVNKPTNPTAFFDNEDGMRGFDREASDLAQQRFSSLIKQTVPGVRKEVTSEAKIKLW